MRDEQLRARLGAYAEEGGVPRGAGPTAAELRRRGHRALLGKAAATLLVVVVAAGGTVVLVSRAGGYRDAGVVDQPGPAPWTNPPSTSPAPPATTLPAPPSTAPTTTTAAPTTTTTATAATAGDQVLAAGGLRGLASFGEPQDRVVARIRDRFGAPDEDRTWDQQTIQYFGACPGDRHRFLRWGRLFALFTNGATDYGAGGRWHFFAWYAEDHQVTGSLDPATAAGIRVGSTVADLRAAYGSALRIFDAADTPPNDGFVVGDGDFNGVLSNINTGGRVTQLSAGQTCGE
jgi:hypothetical protein